MTTACQLFSCIVIATIFSSIADARRSPCGTTCTTGANGKRECCRVRKDFSSMTAGERRRFAAAFKRVSTTQPYKRTYDELIKLHVDLFETAIHQMVQFLPWHRYYILQLENLLRRVDCHVTLPYWDWSVWSHDPFDTRHSMWRSDDTGLGGTGYAPDYCVRTGPFRKGAWMVAPAARGQSSCLRRNFTGVFPDAVAVSLVLDIPSNDFTTFELSLRENLHDAVHCQMSSDGGHMCSALSSAAPEFFLHHGFVDKIWEDWQKKSPQHRNAYFSTQNTALTGYGSVTVSQLLDPASLPGGTCVKYSEPTHDRCKNVLSNLHKLKPSTLKQLPRRKQSCFPADAVRLFKLDATDMKKVNLIRRALAPQKTVDAGHLKGFDKVLGFRVPPRARMDEATDAHWLQLAEDTPIDEDFTDDDDDEEESEDGNTPGDNDEDNEPDDHRNELESRMESDREDDDEEDEIRLKDDYEDSKPGDYRNELERKRETERDDDDDGDYNDDSYYYDGSDDETEMERNEDNLEDDLKY